MQTTKDGKKVIYIDASALKDVGCLRKFYWSVFKGYCPSREMKDNKMAYGSAYHLPLQYWYSITSTAGSIIDKTSLQISIDKATDYYSPYQEFISEDDFRTVPHLIASIKAYYDRYFKDNTDGLKAIDPTAVELKWTFPYWHNENYVIMLCGTIDMLADYWGQTTIVDHKTTASYAKNYFNGYTMDIQTMFYTWMDNHINQRGNVYLPVMINGIFLKKQTEKAMKEGRWDGVNFERSQLISYTAEQMEQFNQWLITKLNVIVSFLDSNVIEAMENDLELSFCRTPYGLCKYFNVCSCQQPSLQKEILERSGKFESHFYNPLSWRD